ncbi:MULTISPECIES: ABC transporter ATP-binding protein [unclassified Marinobacter]|uniref:ABC transporter ATP-binding protein n=1 Tax=unclassified Marinobacter TaxID=83889 RepID=UPI0026E174CE|nr:MULTISPECIES: ABC transporter ATP-binding protein [unclassified Marinobacter]MDO6442801.1 ABC transporter ATP-binding protein [Marinobacter sp. 2_MG-2023]MDO6822981.1 ABC transporter ATP-binding protein [Marinobacter sp. 1_MG-2023]
MSDQAFALDAGAGVQEDLACTLLSKHFGEFAAVDEVSFSIPRGAFFSILGPSGCGKTTLLRMLAGFQQPDSGDILIKGQSVLNTPPNKRPVNMVFQHLALFPTMSVAENIAYGLKRKGVPKREHATLIDAVLAKVQLPDYGKKRIDQLSGGQKQRVAIARCLVLNPAVLLLDEPLGALDLKLREQMKIELKRLQREFNTTFVYITHDQSEALVMSDQVAVMNKGRFEQVGTPQELYYHPKTPFVASFIGDSNQYVGKVQGQSGKTITVVTEHGVRLLSQSSEETPPGSRITVFIRPEVMQISLGQPEAEQDNCLQVTVLRTLFDGARSQLQVETAEGAVLTVALPQTADFHALEPGRSVYVSWQANQCLCFPVAPVTRPEAV